MHQLMLAHIRMLIIIQMYRKWKRYILLTVLSFFLILTFTALRVGLRLKGLAQAKIIKKSVILFRVLNMTI